MSVHPNKTTIRDVAREAGVGVGTVSRALNGGERVSETTLQRVKAAVRRLDFRPNAQARRINRRRAEIVCFLFSNREFPNSFHAQILQGVENCARFLKQHVFFAAVHYKRDTPPEQIILPPILEERGMFDGLIIAGTNYPNLLRRVQKMEIPFVVFGNNLFHFEGPKDFDQVRYDGYHGELEAVRYLISQGHRHVAFAGDTAYPWVATRHAAYLKALSQAKLAPASITVPKALDFVDYGGWAAARVLARKPRPTAITAANDQIAYGLWRSFRRRGVRIPEDISLTGFDDREEATLMDPPLTTVRVKKEEVGQACMKMLLERLRNPGMAFTERVLSTELVIRSSVRRV